jgi:microcystin-dependent protein
MDAYIGEIRLFAGNYAPFHWTLCTGQILSITGNEALFSVLGNTYGGDGRASFAIPDFRGRIPVGEGTGSGLAPRPQGQQFGTETVTLTIKDTPSHNHQFMVSSNDATTPGPADKVVAKGIHYLSNPETGNPGTMPDLVITSVGNDGPHNNMMPFLAINFILCIQGTYPSRN